MMTPGEVRAFYDPDGRGGPESRYQFERQGYFCVDTKDSTSDRFVFNRTVGLRDTWARIEKAEGG